MSWWKKEQEAEQSKPKERDRVVESAERVQDALEELRKVLANPKE